MIGNLHFYLWKDLFSVFGVIYFTTLTKCVQVNDLFMTDPPALPGPYLATQPFVGQFVVTQGDVWLFAECKDAYWAINGHQKGTISGV